MNLIDPTIRLRPAPTPRVTRNRPLTWFTTRKLFRQFRCFFFFVVATEDRAGAASRYIDSCSIKIPMNRRQ